MLSMMMIYLILYGMIFLPRGMSIKRSMVLFSR